MVHRAEKRQTQSYGPNTILKSPSIICTRFLLGGISRDDERGTIECARVSSYYELKIIAGKCQQ